MIEALRAPFELSRRIILFRGAPNSRDRCGFKSSTRFAQADLIVLGIIVFIVQRLPVAVKSREQSVAEIRWNNGLRLGEVGDNACDSFVRKALRQDCCVEGKETMIAPPSLIEQLDCLLIVSAVNCDTRLTKNRQAAFRMHRALSGKFGSSALRIAMPEERSAQRRIQAWGLRMGIKQALVKSRCLVESCLLLQRLGIERPGKWRIFRLLRHLACVRFHLAQARNPQSEPGRAEFGIERDCARKFLSRSREFANGIISAPKSQGCLWVGLIDLFRCGKKPHRLERFAGAEVVVAEK